MNTDRQVGASQWIDPESPWQQVIGDGLLEAQTNLAELTAEEAGPTLQGWQIVGQAFESGLRALAAMRS